MKKIAVLTGTRAEYGLLKPVLRQIEADGGLALRLIVTGAHLEGQFGETVREIEQDGFPIHYKVHMNLTSDKTEGILHSMALELNGLAEIFAKETFDLLILLGDRYELMMAAACAVMNRVPIAHIHGVELTQGAVDDCFRHSVTKMAAIHFTSTERYRRRVIQMGEQPGRVFSVGALGVSNIRKIQFLSGCAVGAVWHFLGAARHFGDVSSCDAGGRDGCGAGGTPAFGLKRPFVISLCIYLCQRGYGRAGDQP